MIPSFRLNGLLFNELYFRLFQIINIYFLSTQYDFGNTHSSAYSFHSSERPACQQCSGSIPKVNQLTYGIETIVNRLPSSGVRVNGVSCLDNCPEVRWVAFTVRSEGTHWWMDGQTDGRKGTWQGLRQETMQSSHPEMTVWLMGLAVTVVGSSDGVQC